MRIRLSIVLLSLLLALSFGSALAQDGLIRIQKVACMPGIYLKGDRPSDNETAKSAVKQVVVGLFNKIGMSVVDDAAVTAAILHQHTMVLDKSEPTLPTPELMLAVGKATGADYVLAYKCRWDVKAIYQITGTHTKATCELTPVIIDVKKEEIVYHPDPTKADSQQKVNGTLIAVSLLAWGPGAWVSGGPETNPMCRAGQIAMAEALDDFGKAHMVSQQPQKIGG